MAYDPSMVKKMFEDIGVLYVAGIKQTGPNFLVSPLPNHPKAMQYERNKRKKTTEKKETEKTKTETKKKRKTEKKRSDAKGVDNDEEEEEEAVGQQDGEEEGEVVKDPEVYWVPECILFERWAVDSRGSQRQYLVKWKGKGGGEKIVVADVFEKDEHEEYELCVKEWIEKCKRHGDETPMPCPIDKKPTRKMTYTKREYK